MGRLCLSCEYPTFRTGCTDLASASLSILLYVIVLSPKGLIFSRMITLISGSNDRPSIPVLPEKGRKPLRFLFHILFRPDLPILILRYLQNLSISLSSVLDGGERSV